MIVNQAFVHRFFAGRNPIGQRIQGWGRWFRVVGVAQDAKYHYLGESATPYFYVPFRQVYRADMNLAFYVRTHGDPDNVLTTLRAQMSTPSTPTSQSSTPRRSRSSSAHRSIRKKSPQLS